MYGDYDGIDRVALEGMLCQAEIEREFLLQCVEDNRQMWADFGRMRAVLHHIAKGDEPSAAALAADVLKGVRERR